MVVVEGLTDVEPLADVEVKVPGAMAMLVAPVTDQLRMLLAPEVRVVGLAVKEVIVGAEALPEDELEGIVEPHPSMPTQISKMRLSTPGSIVRRARTICCDNFTSNP